MEFTGEVPGAEYFSAFSYSSFKGTVFFPVRKKYLANWEKIRGGYSRYFEL